MTPTRTQSTPSTQGTPPVHRALLINMILCVALVVQFLFGMVTNLFVTIPGQHPGAAAHDFFAGVISAIGWAIPHGPAWLAAHIVLGLVLTVGGLANLVTSRHATSKRYVAGSILGSMAIIGAAFNGASFLNYGHESSSMLMAGLWILALSSYLLCLYLSARRPGYPPLPPPTGSTVHRRPGSTPPSSAPR